MQDQPKTKCCNAEISIRYLPVTKNQPFEKNIDYLYCSKCDTTTDNNNSYVSERYKIMCITV